MQVFIAGVQMLVGIALILTGAGIGAGIALMLSGGVSLLGAAFGDQLGGAAGQAVLGVQAIVSGIQLLSCNPIGGLITLAAGASCIAFASSEAQEAFGCGNWIKDSTGMSDGWYTGLMIASNVGATAGILYNQYGPKSCFIAGTLVLCRNENGEECRKPIEEIEVGDMVWAYDEETGESDWKPVVRLFRNESKDWIIVKVKGEEIESTPGHKYYLPQSKEWISAEQLKVGNKVLLSSGEYGIIESVKSKHYDEPQTTYNFEVEEYHTYYVSEIAVLVHNKCKQEIVAGDENGWNAKVSVGGEVNHKTPHAHINWKNQKLASIDAQGKILVQSKMNKNTQRKMLRFIKDNIEDIIEGINKWY